MSAEQSDDSESDAPSMASPRLPRADVYAIVAAERDPDISAMDVRHLLEDNYGVPRDSLLPHKEEIMTAFQALDRSELNLTDPLTSREWLVKAVITGACSYLLHSEWWQPSTLFGWLGFCVISWAAGYLGEFVVGRTVIPFWVQGVLRLPTSPDPELAADEMHGIAFPGSDEARRTAERRVCRVDHLIYTCQRLEDGVRYVEELVGVRPSYGGAHPGLGTHNALLSLGEDTYLEIIAPDPKQPPPPRARPFGLDDKTRPDALSSFAVHPVPKMRWRDGCEVNRGATLEGLAAAMQLAGGRPGLPIRSQQRLTPGGDKVSWRFTLPFDALGATPFLMDWGRATNSPHQTAPRGCKLAELAIHVAADESKGVRGAEAVLQGMGLQGLGERIGIMHGDLDELVAWVDTPRKGRVRLGSVTSEFMNPPS